MNLRDIVAEQSIAIGLDAQDKETAINRLIDLAELSGKLSDVSEAKAEVWEREKIMSTGIGGGIALPHAKTNAVKEPVGALAVLAKGIDFDALDGEDVEILFLLLGRENNVGMHLRLLSKISRLMSSADFKQGLLEAKDSRDVLDLFSRYDSATSV